MKKKWFFFSTTISFIVILLTVFLSTQLKVVSEVDDKKSVLKNKIWMIQFTNKLDPTSINEKTVYVLNENGEKENVAITLNEDKTAIIIIPPEDGYNTHNPNYTLYVTNEVKSNLGRNLAKVEKISFTVKESLPKAESKSNLNAYLLKRLKEEEKTFFATGESKESSKSDSASGNAYSETNVQVQGIDEGDMVKSDGTYIYQVKDGKLHIVKALPANNMSLETLISFNETFYPNELFLHKDQLIVMGYSYEKTNDTSRKMKGDFKIAPIQETTKVMIYDVKNKKAPKKIREIDIEGYLVASRLMEGKAYLIVNKYPEIWLLKENPEIDIRPKYYDSAKNGEVQAVDYDDIQLFPDSNEANFTNIAVIDLEKPGTEFKLSTYLGSGNQIYMSKNNLYLAITNYIPLDKEGSQSYSPNTTVYKYAVNGMAVDFLNSNEVPGTVLNQFSMDEYKGFFRIATTKGQVWDDNRPSANNLYILDENLKQVGKLEDLARGERIYSARFMNDRIYLVTFKETDPLFVIDGSNPRQPKVLGELKIPGFSNYLHPYDENHLIGFGYDTKVLAGKGQGNQPIIITNGVKISLFDVSDMKNPKEKFTEIIGGRGTYSPLNYDHKALLFDKNKNIFAFPITVYENNKTKNELEQESTFTFQGAYVYRINLDKGFSLQKKITHHDGKAPYEEWENNIDRILYIDDALYMMSPNTITSYDLGSYKQLGKLKLAP